MASETQQKVVAYISNDNGCDEDLVIGFIEFFFKFKVMPFTWEKSELEISFDEYMDAENEVACVIISTPLECDSEDVLAVWEIVRQVRPTVPVLWLIPEDQGWLNFLNGHPTADAVRVLKTDSSLSKETVRKFFSLITALTDTIPSIEMVF